MIKKVDGILEWFEKILIAGSIIAMAAMLIVNVLLRTFFDSGLSFSEEVGQILLMFVTFGGMSYVVRHGKHIRMSAVYDIVSPRIRKFLATIIALFACLAAAAFAWIALKYVLFLHSIYRITPALQIPVYIVTLVVVYGFAVSAVQYGYIFVLNLRKPETYLGTYVNAENIDFEAQVMEDQKGIQPARPQDGNGGDPS